MTEWEGSCGVQPHADPDRMRVEPCEHLSDRRERTRCRREGDEEGVSLRVDLDPTVSLEGRAQDAAMRCKSRCIPLRTELVEHLVDPSTSVKRKVTVPEGRSRRTAS